MSSAPGTLDLLVDDQEKEAELMEDGRPLFVQIAEQIEGSVLDGSLAEGERAPSTNELASFHRINPATAAKGINLLVDRQILVKRRGLGMFVADGARELLRAQRREDFAQKFVVPLITEAHAVGLSVQSVIDLLRERAQHREKDNTEGGEGS